MVQPGFYVNFEIKLHKFTAGFSALERIYSRCLLKTHSGIPIIGEDG
jgi:hypothetical protein